MVFEITLGLLFNHAPQSSQYLYNPRQFLKEPEFIIFAPNGDLEN